MGAAVVLVGIGLSLLAVGVLVGRYYVRDDRQLRRTARHAKSYMHTVSLLLARDHEGAIEQLRAVVAENVDDVEPYFALAALFRSRGEWERAVRVHQSLELRPGLRRSDRLRALYELGLDFRSAGMPRRATRAMEQCLSQQSEHEGAIRALCGLYEGQNRFQDAAQAWEKLSQYQSHADEVSSRRSHLLAAAARQSIAAGELDVAARTVDLAQSCAPQSTHVLTAAAELAAARGSQQESCEHWLAALVESPGLAPYVVPALCDAERARL